LVNGVAEGYALTNHYAYLPGSDLLSGWSNGVVTVARSFEPSRDLLVHVLNMAGTNRVSQFGYLNDAIGRRTQRLDTLAGYALPVTNEFGYNSRSELTSAAMGTNKFGYVFDSIGNRELERVNLTTNVYAANALNQYASVSDGVVWTPEYDLDGNLTFLPSTPGGGAGGEGWYLQWDAENRLVSASNATEVIHYQHDYMGRRILRETAGVTNRFDYDGWALIRERTYSQTHTLTNTYFYGPDLSGSLQGAGTIGGLLARVGEGGVLYYTYDGNGNVSDLVDPTGAIRGHYEYAPFGGLIAMTGDLAATNPFRFSTKRQDESTGLLYYGYRDLDTVWGRWVSRDPIEELGCKNLYAFCGNSSANTIDLFGLKKKKVYGTEVKRYADSDMEASIKPGVTSQGISPSPIILVYTIKYKFTIKKGSVTFKDCCCKLDIMSTGKMQKTGEVSGEPLYGTGLIPILIYAGQGVNSSPIGIHGPFLQHLINELSGMLGQYIVDLTASSLSFQQALLDDPIPLGLLDAELPKSDLMDMELLDIEFVPCKTTCTK